MITKEAVRTRIEKLHKESPVIHISVSLNHHRVELINEPVIIKSVYPNIFRIEEVNKTNPGTHTVQYTEIVSGHIKISEIEDI